MMSPLGLVGLIYTNDLHSCPYNAVVSIGDFLLTLMSDGDADHAVCRVRSAAHPDQLIVTWWISREVALSRELPPPPPVSIESYRNVLKCKLTEVFELCSLSTSINARSVKGNLHLFSI
jgi:hypothetical protein